MRRTFTALLVGLCTAVTFAETAHNAHWYNQDSFDGRFSVILNQPDGTESVVAVAREKGIDTTVAGIGTDLTYRRKVLTCTPGVACWHPNIILGIDKDMDGK